MSKILALSDDSDITTRLTATLAVAGFALEFVQQAEQVSRLLRGRSAGALILDLAVRPDLYRSLKQDPQTANTPILLLADPDLAAESALDLDPRDEMIDPFFTEKDILTGLVTVLQTYFKPVPNAAQRQDQFHKARHQLQRQFSRRSDKSLRSDHKHFSRIINRALR